MIPIQIFGNYHFPIANYPKLDPYVGLAFVYSLVSASWEGSGLAPKRTATTRTLQARPACGIS